MRTPDEIKKALEMCTHGADCGHCPYTLYECSKNQMEKDAIAIIQQLEERNTWHEANEKSLQSFMNDMSRQIEQLQAERDAAVAVIRQDGGCNSCLYSDRKVWEEPCLYCEGNERWQWRGVQKEE